MVQSLLARLSARVPLVLPFALAAVAVSIASTAPISASILAGDPQPAKVALQADDQVSLAATYFAPRVSPQAAAGVVLVHDAGGSRADVQKLAVRLQKSGFAVLSLDLRGHGESAANEVPWAKLDTDGQTRLWNSMPRDVKAGVQFLTSQPGVQSATVSLVGHGAGCLLVVRHAVRDEKVRDLVLIAPKLEQLGSTLVHDLAEIAGLPTYIAVGKDDAPSAKRISEFANRSSSTDAPTAETNVLKVDTAELLSDNKLAADMARWMQGKVAPGAAGKTVEAKAARKDEKL